MILCVRRSRRRSQVSTSDACYSSIISMPLIVNRGSVPHATTYSWVRFEQSSCNTPSNQHPERKFGTILLFHHDSDGTTAFIPEDCFTGDVSHLRYAGSQVVSHVLSTPALVEVNLVRTSGDTAFTGNCKVNLFPREDSV